MLSSASLLLSGYLIRYVSSGVALAWMQATIGCLAAVVLLKMAGYVTANLTGHAAFRISGHAAFSAMFYTSAALITALGRPRWLQTTLLAATTSMVSAIAFSRLLVHAHTLLEALLGSVLGFGFAAAFARVCTKPAQPAASQVWQTLAVLTALTAGRIAVSAMGASPEKIILSAAALLTGSRG